MDADALEIPCWRLLEESLDAVLVVDCDSERIVQANPAAQRLTRQQYETLRDRRFYEVINTNGTNGGDHLLDSLRDTGFFHSHEKYQIHREDSEPVAVDVSASRLQTASRQVALVFVRETPAIPSFEGPQEELRRQLDEQAATLVVMNQAIEEALNGIAIAGMDRRLSYVNAAFLQMWGYDEPDEVLGRQPTEFWAEPEAAQEVIQQLLENSRCRREFVAVRRDGSQFDVELAATLVRDERGHPTYLVSSYNDITARKQALRALRDSKEHLQLLINAVPAGVALLDRELRYLACSRRWISDYGLEGKEIIGRCHYDVFPEIPERWRKIHRRCLTGASERCEEDHFERLDGSTQYIRWLIEPWRTSDGEVGGLAFFTEDITERVDAERALRVSKEQLAESQQVAHLGNWVWDIVPDTIAWSDEVYRIFGREPQSFVPSYERDFLSAVHPEDRQRVSSVVANSLKHKVPYSVDHRVVRPDGTERIVHEQATVEYDADDRPVRMFGIVHDITERVHADEQLAQLREQLAHASRVDTMGELASGIAHELNQPLTAIHLQAHTASLLAERLGSDVGEKLRNSLELIGEQSLRAGDIVRRMRSFVRHHVPQCEWCTLANLLNDVLKLMENELRLSGVTCDVRVSRDVPTLCIDQVQIQQVLVNLIQNAIDAMSDQEPDNRQLTIRIDLRDEVVAVRVADTGSGLTSESAQRVFDAFHSTKDSGLGLGLAICRTLIEAHGGNITACPGDDGGAVFEFCLPAEEDKQLGCLQGLEP